MTRPLRKQGPFLLSGPSRAKPSAVENHIVEHILAGVETRGEPRILLLTSSVETAIQEAHNHDSYAQKSRYGFHLLLSARYDNAAPRAGSGQRQ
jgi:hypothetical protein